MPNLPVPHRLENELLDLMQKDPAIFAFMQKELFDGVWFWDLENPSEEWMSPEFWLTLGYEPDSKRHDPSEWQSLIHPEDLKIAQANFEAHCLNPRHPYNQIVRYRHSNGSTVWIQCRGLAIRDAQGKPVRMLGLHTNITALKESEQALQKQHQRWSFAMQSSGIGIWDRDISDRIISCPETWHKILGYPQIEKTTDIAEWEKRIHPDDLENYEKALQAYLRGLSPVYSVQYRVLDYQGRYKWLLEQGKLIDPERSGSLMGTHTDITHIKSAEAEKQKAEQLLGNILRAASGIAIIATDLSGEIAVFNSGAEEMLGYEALELIGKQSPAIFHLSSEVEARGQELTAKYGKDIQGFAVFVTVPDKEGFEEREWTYVHKQGHLIHVLLKVTAIFDTEGNKQGYLGIAQDITLRKLAEQERHETALALRKTQVLLEQISRMARIGGWEVNLNTGDIFWSEITREIHEVSVDFTPNLETGLNFYKEGPDRLAIQHAVEEAIASGKPYDLDLRLITAKGREIWVRALGETEFEGNKCVRMFGAFQDVDQQKKSQERLQESELKFRGLYELSPVGICLNDLNSGLFLDANQAMLDSCGYTLEEFKLLNYLEMTPVEYHASDAEQIKQLLQFGKYGPYEKEFIKKDGVRYPVLMNGILIAYQENEFIWSLVQDISERKKMENQIIQERNRAEDTSRYKSEFLANMSHEIRTPLNGVIGFTDLLMRTEMNATQKQYVQAAYQSGTILMNLINDILDFSKIEAGKLELSIEKVDVHEMCAQITDIVKYKSHEKNLEILLNIAPDTPQYIWGDSLRIQQILVNLLGNAIKFTHQGEVEFALGFTPIFSESDKPLKKGIFSFSVKDTGIGISDVQQEKIFEMFSQADSSTTRQYGGTGLGLAISNKILNLMNSHLCVESELKKGSRFYFNLDLEYENSTENKTFEEGFDRLKTCLLIDDNFKNLEILENMLNVFSLHSQKATNGIEGLQKIAQNNFDVVIVDYHMPFMDGLSVVKHIRENMGLNSVIQPIILLHSANEDETLSEQCKELQINYQMLKPLTIDRLYRTLRNINDGEGMPETLCLDSKKEAKHLSILIVEDNATNFLLIKNILSGILGNAEIESASDGLIAIEKFAQKKPDLIFMDIQMPRMNGYETTKSIREMESGKGIPIIALTAGAVKGERERCLAVGMDDYITKPISFERIEACLDKWIFSKKNQEPLQANGLNSIHFDSDAFMKTFRVEKDTVALYLRSAYTDCWNAYQLMRQHAQENRLDLLRNCAHQIKGCALNLRLHKLASVAQLLEDKEIQSEQDLKIKIADLEAELQIIKEISESFT
ncbi:MAG: PAS domain S-box protein [Candidatus Sericytochromatia bacterium]